MKFIVRVVPVVIVALIISVIPHDVVKAISDYDNVVQPAISWKAYDGYGAPYDIDIQDAIDNVTNSAAREDCQDIYVKLSQMEYRYFGLIQWSRYSDAKDARIFASNSQPDTTTWSTEGPTKRAHASWEDVVMISVTYDQDSSEVVANACSDAAGTSPDVTFAMRWNDGFTVERPFVTEGFQVDYPLGYEGYSVSNANRTGLIQGGVTCANTNNVISHIQVNVNSGLSGSAKLTSDGSGGKNYQYYLTEEGPYALVVTCDGDPFFSPTVSTDLYLSHQWACTVTGEQHYCAAS
jgi:hypothetical protein